MERYNPLNDYLVQKIMGEKGDEDNFLSLERCSPEHKPILSRSGNSRPTASRGKQGRSGSGSEIRIEESLFEAILESSHALLPAKLLLGPLPEQAMVSIFLLRRH